VKRFSHARRFCALTLLLILSLLFTSCAGPAKRPAGDGRGAGPVPAGTGAAPSPAGTGAPSAEDEELQFLNGNPWSKDARIEKLPVYRNPFYETRDIPPAYFKKAALALEAQDIAKSLGLVVTDMTYESYASFQPYLRPEEADEARQVYAQTDKAIIGITLSCTEVSFHTPQKLPEGFALKDGTLPREDMLRLLSALAEEFGACLGYEKPVPAILTSGSFNGSPSYTYIVYDGAGDITEQILGYSFDYTTFHISGEGLRGFRKYHAPERYKNLGDYEIISWQEAQEMLISGDCRTPFAFDELEGRPVAGEQIAHVELVYRVQNEAEFLMPYYRFHVKFDAGEFDDIAADAYYEWYYVPAVRNYEEYGFIANLTLLRW
jgi:hypothetical protein